MGERRRPGPFRVLVCGGRNFFDQNAVFSELDALLNRHGEIVVIQGGAPGADLVARNWCYAQRDRIMMFNMPADWRRHGRAAGPIRNQAMLDEHQPDLVLAFPGGRGTADMCRRAREAGVPIELPAPRGPEQQGGGTV